MRLLPKLVVILGPTASGKTSLSLDLATQHHGYVISADSRQIYAGMDIGTAKIPKLERRGIPHELLDIRTPDQSFSVAEYKQESQKVIAVYAKRQPELIPFLVGGTMQYIDALIDNWIIPEVAPDTTYRAELDSLSVSSLIERLKTLDPESAASIDLHNTRRVIRALEIWKTTGLSATKARRRGRQQYSVCKIGLQRDRDELYARINERVDMMTTQGLIDEVRGLAELYGWDAPGMNAQGYIQLRPYFENKATLEDCLQKIKQVTRNYAKRQMTWWRKDEGIHWVTTTEEALRLTTEHLKKK